MINMTHDNDVTDHIGAVYAKKNMNFHDRLT